MLLFCRLSCYGCCQSEAVKDETNLFQKTDDIIISCASSAAQIVHMHCINFENRIHVMYTLCWLVERGHRSATMKHLPSSAKLLLCASGTEILPIYLGEKILFISIVVLKSITKLWAGHCMVCNWYYLWMIRFISNNVPYETLVISNYVIIKF